MTGLDAGEREALAVAIYEAGVTPDWLTTVDGSPNFASYEFADRAMPAVEAIADARVEAALAGARALHREGQPFVHPGGEQKRCAAGCWEWPCATRVALDAAATGRGEGAGEVGS